MRPTSPVRLPLLPLLLLLLLLRGDVRGRERGTARDRVRMVPGRCSSSVT
ncbi:hypothetical protein [Streptomyces fagopyri]|nr:hypothetical protein [Streptomyces fagopyri]